MSLSTSALLTSLKVKQWSARKFDKDVSIKVCKDNNAAMDSGNFNKQLVPKRVLKEIQKIVNAARNYHYQNTLAWDHDGADLLPAKHYITYTENMSSYKQEFRNAVNEFIAGYPALLTTVMNDLSGLYNPQDYPSQEQLKGRFSMEVSVTPVPESGDFRIDLPNAEIKKIKSDLDTRLVNANLAAEKDLYMRLYTVVAKAFRTLKTEGKIFRNSLILNIVELANKTPDMNFNETPELNQIAKDLSSLASLVDIEELRNEDNPMYRDEIAEDLAKELKDIEETYESKWGKL